LPEHLAGIGGIRADVAADKWVGILSQSHPGKLRFAGAKARVFPFDVCITAGIWGNTTGLAGKEKMPQLMVFFCKKSRFNRCAKTAFFL
jgi:hypothetical protein